MGIGVYGLILPYHNVNGRNYKRMSGVGKGESCRAEGGLLLQLLSAGKQSEKHGYEIEDICIRKQL